jgi:hypothetical protein
MNRFLFLQTLLVAILFLGCQKNSDSSEATQDSSSNTSQSAMGIAGGIASDSEAGSLGLIAEQVSNEIASRAACAFSTVRTCSGAIGTLAWNSCTIGTITMTGGWTSSYGSNTQCTNNLTSPLANSDYVVRTSTGSTATFASGVSLTTDTIAHSAYDGTSIPGGGIGITVASGTRTVTVVGLHRILRGPSGRKWFDHSITASLSMSGTRAAGTRVVTGTMTLYHNLASYTAANTFNSVTWGDSSCCYPTSGNIATTLSGAASGTINLAFTSTCGAATFTDTTGTTSAVALTYCE